MTHSDIVVINSNFCFDPSLESAKVVYFQSHDSRECELNCKSIVMTV